MNSTEFVFWLKGFTDAVCEEGPTLKQWGVLKDKLIEVKDETPSFPFGTPNTAPIQTVPFIQPADPYNPYKVTCHENPYKGKSDAKQVYNGTTGSGTTYGITTSSNTTWTNLPKGTNISYTANLPKELLND
jgi:hypothetical protein